MCAKFGCGPTVVSKKVGGGGYRQTDRQTDRQTKKTAALYSRWDLHRILSIKVPLVCDNLVGSVICGSRLCDVIRSKNSLHNSSLLILSIFKLLSPAKFILSL